MVTGEAEAEDEELSVLLRSVDVKQRELGSLGRALSRS